MYSSSTAKKNCVIGSAKEHCQKYSPWESKSVEIITWNALKFEKKIEMFY